MVDGASKARPTKRICQFPSFMLKSLIFFWVLTLFNSNVHETSAWCVPLPNLSCIAHEYSVIGSTCVYVCMCMVCSGACYHCLRAGLVYLAASNRQIHWAYISSHVAQLCSLSSLSSTSDKQMMCGVLMWNETEPLLRRSHNKALRRVTDSYTAALACYRV